MLPQRVGSNPPAPSPPSARAVIRPYTSVPRHAPALIEDAAAAGSKSEDVGSDVSGKVMQLLQETLPRLTASTNNNITEGTSSFTPSSPLIGNHLSYPVATFEGMSKYPQISHSSTWHLPPPTTFGNAPHTYGSLPHTYGSFDHPTHTCSTTRPFPSFTNDLSCTTFEPLLQSVLHAPGQSPTHSRNLVQPCFQKTEWSPRKVPVKRLSLPDHFASVMCHHAVFHDDYATIPETEPFVQPSSITTASKGQGECELEKSQGEGRTRRCSPSRYTRSQLLLLGSALLVICAAFASISIMAPFFPHQVEKRGLGATTDGIIFSAYSFVMVVASPIFGKILPLLNMREAYLVSTAVVGMAEICFGMVAFVSDPPVFVAVSICLRSLAAVGTACFFTIIYSLIPLLFPDDMNTMNGMLETAVGLGMCVGPALGVWLYSMGGFFLPFFCLGCFILLTVVVSYFIFPEDEVKIGSNGGTGEVWKIASRPGALLSLIILCSTAVCFAALYPTLEPHMSKLGVSVKGVGLMYLMVSAVYTVAAPLIGLAIDRYGGLYGVMLVGLLLTSLAFILIGNSPLLPEVSHHEMYVQDVVGLVMLALSSAMCIVPTYGAVLQSATSSGEKVDIGTYSVVGGLWSASYSCGEMLGPLCAGFMTEFVNFAAITTLTAILPVVMAVVLGAYMCAGRLSKT